MPSTEILRANNTAYVRKFWQYVLPTIGAMIASSLYQVVDGIFIGRFIGVNGLAGINLAWSIIGALYGLGMMIGVGSGAVCSLEKGAGFSYRARKALSNGLSLILVFGLLSSLAIFFLGDWALDLQSSEGQSLVYAREYLWIVMLTAPLMVGSLALPLMVRNDESPTKSTLIIVAGAILNTLLNAFFVAYLGLGMTGAALGTAISQAVVVILGVTYFFSPVARLRLTLNDISFSCVVSKRICAVGFSSLIMYFYFSFILAVHNHLCMKYGGATLVGAFSIIGYLSSLYYIFAEGASTGTQPLISHHYGAQESEQVKKFVILLFKVNIGVGLLFILMLNVFAQPIVSIFNNDNKALEAAAITGIRLGLFAMFLEGFIFSTGIFFQSLGLSRKATFVTLANIVVQVPFLLVLPKLYGATGIWLAVPLSNIALSFPILWMFIREWKKLGNRSVVAG